MHHRYMVTDSQGGTTYDLTGCLDVSTDAGIETRADKATVRIEKRNMPGFAPDVNDNIVIRLGSGNAQPTEVIMDAVINTLKYTSDEKGHNYTFNCLNRLESLLTNLRPAAYDKDDGWTASKIIIDIVNWANYANAGAKPPVGTWVDMGIGEIAATTLTVDYFNTYKPVFQQIEELSTGKYTGNGDYAYYLDSSNNFVWKPRSTVNAGTLNEAVCQSVQIEKGTWDVINALIIHGGDDLNGNSIQYLAFDPLSYGKIGGKWKYLVRKSWAEEFKKLNPTAINAEVRAGVRSMIKTRGKEMLRKVAYARYKAEMEVDGSNKYVMGGIWTLVVPSFPSWPATGKKLRMTEISHKYGKNGWSTILRFEEDADTAWEALYP